MHYPISLCTGGLMKSLCGVVAGCLARRSASLPPQATATVWTSSSVRELKWTWWMWRARQRCMWQWSTGIWTACIFSWRLARTPTAAATTVAPRSTMPPEWAAMISFRSSSGKNAHWGSQCCLNINLSSSELPDNHTNKPSIMCYWEFLSDEWTSNE